MNTLPWELTSVILFNGSYADLFSYMLVCKEWYRIITNDTAFKTTRVYMQLFHNNLRGELSARMLLFKHYEVKLSRFLHEQGISAVVNISGGFGDPFICDHITLNIYYEKISMEIEVEPIRLWFSAFGEKYSIRYSDLVNHTGEERSLMSMLDESVVDDDKERIALVVKIVCGVAGLKYKI